MPCSSARKRSQPASRRLPCAPGRGLVALVASEAASGKSALVPSPTATPIPAFYALHAWLRQRKPYGMYEDWNARGSCQPCNGTVLRKRYRDGDRS